MARLYGKKSEKMAADATSVQLPLFDMPEPDVEPEPEKVEVQPHTRGKAGRKKLPESLPRVDMIHDIPEEAKVCACSVAMSRIREDVAEKPDIIPATIQVVRNIWPKYACKQCEGLDTQGAVVKIAPVPKQIIEKGINTAGLVAYILTDKFVDALPFYRQEKQFSRLGIDIPRATMCNWAINSI
jgi:transposase